MMTKPTTGRVVHVVVLDETGAHVHRAGLVCEQLPTGDGYDCSIHLNLKPGDTMPPNVMGPVVVRGFTAFIPRVIRARPDVDELPALLGTWHWPEGSPDSREPSVPRKIPVPVTVGE